MDRIYPDGGKAIVELRPLASEKMEALRDSLAGDPPLLAGPQIEVA